VLFPATGTDEKTDQQKTCWGCLFMGCFSGLFCLASWLAVSSSEYPSD